MNNRYVLLAFSLLIPILILGAEGSCDKPTGMKVGFGSVLKLADDNIDAAEDKYKHGVVVFEAEITDMHKNSLKLVPNKKLNASEMYEVDCKMRNKKEKGKFKSLTVGQSINIEGEIDGFEDSSDIITIKMNSCAIIGKFQ